jgi:uncharacterized protein YcbK (DUF882 family)
LAGLLVVFATEGLQTAAADGETRTLTIHHTHTREDITVTYKRNGRYDDGALGRLNHFLRDWRNDDQTRMDPKLFDVVWEVYQDVGASAPIQIISAYRSPATNAMLRRRSRGVAQFSQHMLGKAMDFNIPGVSLDQVRAAGLRLQRGGVGFYPTSGSPFVHLDVGGIRHWPRMTHDQLVRVFPNGRTVHVPSDGQPLAGYALALADVERRGSSPSRISLAAARDSGAVSDRGEVAGKPKNTLLSRLFGYGQSDDDEEERQGGRGLTARARGKAPEKAAEEVRQPVEMAAVVPMPRARPASRSIPVEAPIVASAAPTPVQVIDTRGVWGGPDAFQVADAAADKRSSKGERLVWRQGPQPVTGTTVVASAAPKALPIPRPRPVVLASAGPETTASFPRWPGAAPEERMPGEMALSYAASGSETDTSVRASPMGALQPAQTVVRKTSPARAVADRSPPAGRIGENPWLRGMIAAPSVQTSLAVTVVGPTNYRALARLMHKPHSSIPNSFAEEPEFGMTTETFSGKAIGTVPTIMFGTQTAGLR